MNPKSIYRIPRAYKNRSLAHVLTSLTFTELKEITARTSDTDPKPMDMEFYKTVSNTLRNKYNELSSTVMRLYAKEIPSDNNEYALLDKIRGLTEG